MRWGPPSPLLIEEGWPSPRGSGGEDGVVLNLDHPVALRASPLLGEEGRGSARYSGIAPRKNIASTSTPGLPSGPNQRFQSSPIPGER